ncbi:MAG TPA: septation protein IspZ [Stellaceae bacterium]|jgi:predicted dienelactone hydrolase|nr:septation protein IspZ [Stellaceae bacterium]
MKHAVQHLFTDFLSALLFLAVYIATGNVAAGAIVAIVIGIGQTAFQLATGRRIDPMQWLSLAIVVVLSAASIATNSPRFVMLKPSLAHFAIAAAMLKRGWLLRYLPEIAQRNLPAAVPVAAGYAWAGLMAVLGIANIAVATYADFATWAWFVSVVLIGTKATAFALQYVVFRAIIRRRLVAEATAVRTSAATAAAILAALILATGSGSAQAVGFQQLAVADPNGAPIEVYLWYPSNAAIATLRLGPYEQKVAMDGPIAGTNLPLILISHGTGGSALTHYDTAIALAEAGYIAAAIEHTGDNWHDRSYSFTLRGLTERPRQLKLAVDYLLGHWAARDHIAADRIGAFGHSAGGFTSLVAIGGTPDFALAAAFCKEHPEDWGCVRARAVAVGTAAAAPPVPVWTHDPRIKAAVVAATALGRIFTPAGLAGATVPVQLWQGEDDEIAVKPLSFDVIKANLPSPPEAHLVPLAGHFAFLAPCSKALAEAAPEVCRDPDGFDRVAFHRTFNAAVAAFFAKALNPA